MFKFPMTTKLADQTPVAPVLPGNPPMSAPPALPPLPAPPPPPGIAANGGGARMGHNAAPKLPPPSATKAFKISSIKLGNFAPPQDMFPQSRPRTGIINAVVDTGKDYVHGLGEYTADVLQENMQKTQRPNDPSVMTHHLGRQIV